MKRQVTFFSTSLGLLGVILVLLGSVVMVPYTATETVNNRPHGYTVWADDSLTLQPHANRSYTLDLIWNNGSMVYVKVDEATNPIFFEIEAFLGYGYGGGDNRIMIKQYVPSIEWPESPFEYFWTPPTLFGGWKFIFENPHNTTTNVTVKILCYHYNVQWQGEVTHYAPVIHPYFAYVGIASVIAGIGLNLYEARRRENMSKSHIHDSA